jgi:hypothetical protein
VNHLFFRARSRRAAGVAIAVGAHLAALSLVGCSEERAPARATATVQPVSAGPLARTAIAFPEGPPDEAALAALPPAEAAKVGASPVPVWVPRGSFAEVRVVTEPGFYAYFGVADAPLPDGRVSRATVSVQGTRFAHEHADFPADVSTHRMRGGRGLFTVNEGIVTTTWVEGGASYSVDVECSVAGDPRCKDERFVLELTDGLAFVGGRK